MSPNYTVAHDDSPRKDEKVEIFLRVDENTPCMATANGLNDRTNFLKHLICFALKNDCTLIAPQFNLELQHQYPLEGGKWSGKSRKSNLSEYYNFNTTGIYLESK